MKSMLITVLAALVCGAGPVLAQSGPEITISSDTVSVGGVATVDLSISGLGSGTQIGGYDLNVGFNPGIVSFASASFGDPKLGDQLNLENYGTFSSAIPGTGTVDLAELSFDSTPALQSSQASAFTLVQLTFDAKSAGTSALGLSINAVSDAFGNGLTPALANGSITVTGSTVAAPEIDPSSAFGALTLLAGCLAVARSRSRTPQQASVTRVPNPNA
jgi:hypothetical protein